LEAKCLGPTQPARASIWPVWVRVVVDGLLAQEDELRSLPFSITAFRILATASGCIWFGVEIVWPGFPRSAPIAGRALVPGGQPAIDTETSSVAVPATSGAPFLDRDLVEGIHGHLDVGGFDPSDPT